MFLSQNRCYRIFTVSSDKINDLTIKIGLRIKNLRKEYGFTQEKLSELTGIDYKHIQLLEGKKPSAIRITTLENVCKAFDLKLKDFFDNDLFD